MNGKRTYLIVTVAILYLAGIKCGFWPADTQIIAGLGFAALAFLRAGIKKTEPCGASVPASRPGTGGASVPASRSGPGGASVPVSRSLILDGMSPAIALLLFFASFALFAGQLRAAEPDSRSASPPGSLIWESAPARIDGRWIFVMADGRQVEQGGSVRQPNRDRGGASALNSAGFDAYGTVSWAGTGGKARLGAGIDGSLRIGQYIGAYGFGETDNTGGAFLADRVGGGIELHGDFNKWLEGFARLSLGYVLEASPGYIPDDFFWRPQFGLRANLIKTKNFALHVGPSYGWDISFKGRADGRAFLGGGFNWKF